MGKTVGAVRHRFPGLTGEERMPELSLYQSETATTPPLVGSGVRQRRAEPASLAVCVLITLTLLAAMADLIAAGSFLSVALTFFVAVSLPGAACLTFTSVGSNLVAVALGLGLSLSVDALLSSVMLWLHVWHPIAAGCIVAVLSVALLSRRTRMADIREVTIAARAVLRLPARDSSQLRASLPGLISLVVGLVLWATSLPLTHPSVIGQSGLLSVVPLTWYLGFVVLVIGLVHSIVTPSRPMLTVALIAGLIVVIYATIPIVSSVPQYSYTYKHIGVTRLFMTTGRVHSGIDIYNRWPGFFAAAAVFSRLAGADPLSYAGWYEPAFMLLNAILVFVLAVQISHRARAAFLAVVLWLAADWVGQSYFSPQGFAYPLTLVAVIAMLASLHGGVTAPHRLSALVTRIVRSRSDEATESNPIVSRRLMVVAVLLLDVAVVISHQLSPYMLFGEAAVLTLFGLRPRWLFVLLLVIAIAYLLPNFSYINSHYGLLSGLNPVQNAQVSPGASLSRPWLFQNDGKLLTYSMILLAIGGGIGLARRGNGDITAMLIVLTLAPFVVLFLNSYGGEGVLRAVLFSSPWASILVGWRVDLLPRIGRIAASFTSALALQSLLVIGFLGSAGATLIPPSEVTASAYFYAKAPARSQLMLAGPSFPGDLASRYAVMTGESSESRPNILDYPYFIHHDRFGAEAIPELVSDLRALAVHPFMVFSESQFRYVALYHAAPQGSLQSLEHAVARSSHFRLWYSNASTQIFKLVK